MPKRLSTRERLIDAGLDLIYARSYADVSVDDICRRARVNKGSFYHCFKSKSELAIAILDAQLVVYTEEILQPAFMNDRPPLEKIDLAFKAFANYQEKVKSREGRALGCLFGNLALELSSLDKHVRDHVRTGLGFLAKAFEMTLEEAMARGDLPKGDAALGAEQLVAYLQGVILWSKLNDAPSQIRALGPQPGLPLHLPVTKG